MTPEMAGIISSFNLFVLASLLVWSSHTNLRVLRSLRTVLKANAELVKITEEARDLLIEQQEALQHAGQVAAFWYTMWLRAEAKR